MSEPFVYNLKPNTEDSHQVSPAWMLTFVRWKNRNPYNFENSNKEGGNLATATPLIVTSDCVSVSVSASKATHTPSMTAMLKSSNTNYLTAVAPGDFVFVNICDWEHHIDEVKHKAESLQPINEFKDGFKGIFKVQSVRMVLSINPETGTKQVMFQIDGYGFTEFNNLIYFNPHAIPAGSDQSLLFLGNLSKNWHELFRKNGIPSVQDVIKFFIESFIGQGKIGEEVDKLAKQVTGKNTIQLNYNTHFFVPTQVGQLLGKATAKAAKDLYVYLMGVQKYENRALGEGRKQLNFLPSNIGIPLKAEPIDEEDKAKTRSSGGKFYYTNSKCQGLAIIQPDYWNQVSAWNILNQYLNAPINEMFTCYRVAPDSRVMPTLVVRQIPFSSEKYKEGGTKFLSLPRWKLSPKLVYDMNLGRDEALRINFVQVFGFMGGTANPGLSIASQVAKGNYEYDINDIKRSGLRPYVINSSFDIPPGVSKDALNSSVLSPDKTNVFRWARLLGDALIGGHLKMSGTVTCAGIDYPIAPGDNLELGDTVYHIESVSHTASVSPGGEKSFKTILELSHGVNKNSNDQKTVYAQMTNTQLSTEQKEDYENGGGLPGFSGDKYSIDSTQDEKANINFDLPKRIKQDKKETFKKVRKNKKDS